MELQVLIKYIEGTSSDDQKQKVENWLSAEPGNAVYLEKVKKIWLSLDGLNELATIDVNRDWELVEKRMSGKTNKKNLSVIKTQLFYLGRIAAVFLLGAIVSGIFFYFSTHLPEGKNISQARYEFNVPEGQKSDLVLPDGTKVQVNAGSKISFSKEFSETNREIWMEGEAYFEVKKDSSNPFIVHTPGINVKVMGTTFNIRAYSNEQLIETTLVEGKVLLSRQSGSKSTEAEIALEPNHKAVYLKNKDARISAELAREFRQPLKIGEILISDEINTQASISWTEGKLIFDNEYFDVIADRLENFYGVSIRIEDESLNNLRYTGTLKKVSIEQALKALQLTTSVNYKMNNNEIILTKR